MSNINGITNPIPTQTIGPDWANDIFASFVAIDNHDHTPGNGVQLTPQSLLINTDLPFIGNNATDVRAVRFSNPIVQPLPVGADVYCVYAFGGDLYYNNGIHAVQVTSGNSVVGLPGQISGMTGTTATVIYAPSVYSFNAAPYTPAGLACYGLVLQNPGYNLTPGTLSLVPPTLANSTALQMTLPPIPSAPTSQLPIVCMNSMGTMSTALPDGTTINNGGGVLSAATSSDTTGISPTNIMNGWGLTPSGAIIPFGGAAPPTGYLLCDGTTYNRVAFAKLFAAIGTAYGNGDGSTTFNVPDLRGLFMRGINGARADVYRDPDAAARTAINGGNSGNALGSVQLNTVGPHTHQILGTGVGAGSSGGSSLSVISDNNGQNFQPNVVSNGNNETRPSNIYVNYIIKI